MRQHAQFVNFPRRNMKLFCFGALCMGLFVIMSLQLDPIFFIQTKSYQNSEDDVPAFSKRTIELGDFKPLLRNEKLTLSQHTDITISKNNVAKTKIYNELFKSRKVIKYVNCRTIAQGNITEIALAREWAIDHPKHAIQPSQYINAAGNCARFIKHRQYITSPLSKMEDDFPIAYSILLYKDIEQTERLLRAIYRPQNFYCIHVDGKSPDILHRAMKAISNCFDNVFMAPKRIAVTWGQMSVLKPELVCMEALLKISKKWKYFINLTGQEFPLRTNYELVKILTLYNGSNDVGATVERNFTNRWIHREPAPHGFNPIKGPVHIVASRAFVDYAINDQRAIDLLNWTRYTEIPDETFFQTLNHNPELGVPGSYTGFPETDSITKPWVARYKNRYQRKCHGYYVRGVCIMATGDLPILAERKEMFVNKIFLKYHQPLLDCLEEFIHNRTRDELMGQMTFDTTWYSALDFISKSVKNHDSYKPVT